MDGLRGWRGGTSDTNVVLVEPPAVQLCLDGLALNPLLLRYPKYSLQLLAANMAAQLGGRIPPILDLKDARLGGTQRSAYARLRYEDRDLSFHEVGADQSSAIKHLRDAEVVCVSCTFTMERRSTCGLLASIRRACPSALIVAGGHDATVAPTPYLKAGADLCVLGEGETVLGEILAARSGDALRQIRGVAFLAEDTGRRTGKRAAHRLDEIHYPARETLISASCEEYPDGPWPQGVGPRFAVVETSRGCDEACNFCSSTFVSGRFRSWSVAGVLGYAARLKRENIRTLLFADDNLLYRMLPQYGGDAGRAELIALFGELRDLGFCWTFYNGIQFGLLETAGSVDHELIGALFRSGYSASEARGCFEAYLPIERFDAEQAAAFPKLRPPEVQREIIAAIAAERPHQLNIGFIVGSPADGRQTIDDFYTAASSMDCLIGQASGGMTRVRHLPWCSIPLPATPNRSRYRSAIRYDLDEHPELHSNYVSAIAGVGATPLDFTLGRRWLDDTLNASLELPSPQKQWAHA